MEFFGRVEHKEPVRTGISKTTGNEWKSTVVVFQDPNSRKAVAVSVFGEHNIQKLQKGAIGTVRFSTYIREYTDKNGVTRYTNDLSFDSWETMAQQVENNPFEEASAVAEPQPTGQASPAPQAAPAPAPQPAPAPVPQAEKKDDLPF